MVDAPSLSFLCFFKGGRSLIFFDYINFGFSIIEACSSSTLSTSGFSISFSSLSNLVPIEFYDIFSALWTPESVQASNNAAKNYSASWRRSPTIYPKRHISRTSFHSNTGWVPYQREVSHKSTGHFLSIYSLSHNNPLTP